MSVEVEFADYLLKAINDNYLITALITSQTQAKVKSQNLPFGLGKTTLLLWLMYHMNGENWETVFTNLCGNPYHMIQLLKPSRERIHCAGWDAVQMTAPAEQGVPRVIRRLASYLSDTRPEVACILMTASNINAIAAPLRKLVIFEAIVTERGHYEIQKISYHKNFKQPLVDLARLGYLEEGEFPKLPAQVYERYELWRVQSKMNIYPQLVQELNAYMDLKEAEQKPLEPTEFEASVIKQGGHFVMRVPYKFGEENHRVPLIVATRSKDKATP